MQFAVGARPSARSSALRADEALYAKKADKGQFMAADGVGLAEPSLSAGLAPPNRLSELGKEASGVRLQVRVQKVTGRRRRSALIRSACSAFLLLRTSHIPPHLPVEPVDNSLRASAARVPREGSDGEGGSVRRRVPCGIPSLGEARRRVRKEREFPTRKHEGRPWAPFDFRFSRV